MPSQQPIISTSTLVDCCIIHLTSLHFPLALVYLYRLSNFRMLMLLGYITFIYPTNCIDVNIELYRVSIHNHRKTTGSNVLPTESFIPSHTHIHSSCCYDLVDCLYNHVHWHTTPLLCFLTYNNHITEPHMQYISKSDAVGPSDDSNSPLIADFQVK